MTKISMSNILDVKFEEFNIDELDPEGGIKMEDPTMERRRVWVNG